MFLLFLHSCVYNKLPIVRHSIQFCVWQLQLDHHHLRWIWIELNVAFFGIWYIVLVFVLVLASTNPNDMETTMESIVEGILLLKNCVPQIPSCFVCLYWFSTARPRGATKSKVLYRGFLRKYSTLRQER